LVYRRVDVDDRRRKHLALTSAGESAVKRAELRIRKTIDRVGQSMSVSERRRADEGLLLWGAAMRDYLLRDVDEDVSKSREPRQLPSTA
jgi:DNA-binding MarR family transcriptional regulator